ncbi:NAD-dependent epimerase/dehydratase family protein [Herbiconiux sp. P18]|uniref:NAD-dependent epimerase/dehydratase family protein n=1 Tax=Herbiconiux liangxiaofengii TaxID=3342795 RepID=UPI0035B904C3
MRVLVLGGSEFVGRAVVEAALAQGAEVTVVNRGTHPAPAGVRWLRADRRVPDELADALRAAGHQGAGSGGAERDSRFDLVVDTWSWEPWVVRDSARLLEPWAERYLLVSSRSVYADPVPAGATERHPVVESSADDGDPRQPGAVPAQQLDYARMKAGGERAVQEAFGDRGIVVRPGLVLGPWENVGRLPWWLGRIARGGEVLAPGDPATGIQFIDARDLAWWLLGLPEAVTDEHRDAPGAIVAFDAVSPVGRHTMGGLLEACVAVTGSSARLRWLPEPMLLAGGVQPWTGLPIWLPAGADHDSLHGSDVSKALGAGLVLRPLEATVADTWAWLGELGGAAPRRADRPALGLDPALERRLLDASTGS